MVSLINLNGQILPADSPLFRADNRSFRYGDGLFESIRVAGGVMPFFDRHWHRLSLGMKGLKINPPSHFGSSFFKNEISKLIDYQGNWRVRLSVFRGGAGLYAPSSSVPDFLIEISPMDGPLFQLNERGLRLGIFDEIRLLASTSSRHFTLQNFKTNNALPFVLAAIFIKENSWDDCLLLNNEGRIACGSSSNVFWRKNRTLYTPPLSEGCVAGTMRSAVIGLAQQKGVNLSEQPFFLADLESADEVFLTNAIQGIRWVESCGANCFGHESATMLHQSLLEEFSQKR